MKIFKKGLLIFALTLIFVFNEGLLEIPIINHQQYIGQNNTISYMENVVYAKTKSSSSGFKSGSFSSKSKSSSGSYKSGSFSTPKSNSGSSSSSGSSSRSYSGGSSRASSWILPFLIGRASNSGGYGYNNGYFGGISVYKIIRNIILIIIVIYIINRIRRRRK